MKKTIKGILGFALCLAVLPTIDSNAYEDKSFASQEKALDFFVERIRESDLEGALQAFPIKRAAEQFDFEKYLDYFQVWIADSTMNYPSTSELFISLNENSYASRTMEYIQNFVTSLSTDPAFLSGKSLTPENTDITGLMEASSQNAEKISGLEIERLVYYNPEEQDSEAVQKNMQNLAALYGADGLSSYLVIYRLDSNFWTGGMTFIQYGDEYYIWEPNCMMMNTVGAAMPMSEEEHDSILAELEAWE